jgi:hypothetical protein
MLISETVLAATLPPKIGPTSATCCGKTSASRSCASITSPKIRK